MTEINTDIVIDAPASAIWQTLIDFAGHSDWNPFITNIQGVCELGRRLSVTVQPAHGKAMHFKPQVIAVLPGQELRWRGRFLVPGLFDGEHHFKLLPLGEGRTRFIHGELFSGWLLPFLRTTLMRSIQPSFEAMNHALKLRMERTGKAEAFPELARHDQTQTAA